MANLDSTLGAEQMESTTAGKCVSPTSWSVLAFGIQLNKMPFFPWRQYQQFLEKPLIVGIVGFALQYFCNDLNGAVQRQGYGVITFAPYIVMFSIMFAVSVFWWIIYGRRLESCQGLETLPCHRQDIQMNETQQPTQEIQRNETLQAGDVQMDQAAQGTFMIRPEEFFTVMDYWFSTRLGEMTRDEAFGKMKRLGEIGNRRSRDISIESTADETRAVMNKSLKTRGDGSRRLSAGSITDGTHNPVLPIRCPGAADSNNQARSLSHDALVLKIPQNVNVEELGEIYDANLNESLETRGDGSRRLSAGSITDGTHNLVFPILCPGAANSNNQARSLSHDALVLKIPQNVNVEEFGEIYDANLNESLETRGDGSRRLSAGSITDETHNPVFPILCPGTANSNNQARSLSHDALVLKIPQNVNLPGNKELHRRIEIGPENGRRTEADNLKRRKRPSKKPPTQIIEASPDQFRATVQELTGQKKVISHQA